MHIQSRRTGRFDFPKIDSQLLEKDEGQDCLREHSYPSRQKSPVKSQRTGSLESVEEDEGDPVLAGGGVEDARLHHIQRLGENRSQSAG